MRRFALAAGLAATLAAMPSPSASAVPLSASVQQDLRCFMLFAAAVDQAGKAKNEQVRQAGSLGVMYFLGKLIVEAPTLNLADAVRQEGKAMDANPHVKEVGAACDSEFAKRGQELVNFGQELQKTAPQSSSSS
jgi:hypothetical protein